MKQSHNLPDAALLRQAIDWLHAGQARPAARQLARLLRGNPGNAAAWYWLASALDAPERQRACLERALRLDPQLHPARLALARLEPPRPAAPNPQAAALTAQARAAEAGQAYAAAYQFYSRALDYDPGSAAAWLGKGTAAVLRPGEPTAGFRVFYDCLGRACGAHSAAQRDLLAALSLLDESMALDAAGRLVRLARFAGTLAATLPGAAGARCALEHVRLAGLACALARQHPQIPAGARIERQELAKIAQEAAARGAALLAERCDDPAGQRRLAQRLRAALLVGLAGSELAADARFVRQLDDALAQGLRR